MNAVRQNNTIKLGDAEANGLRGPARSTGYACQWWMGKEMKATAEPERLPDVKSEVSLLHFKE